MKPVLKAKCTKHGKSEYYQQDIDDGVDYKVCPICGDQTTYLKVTDENYDSFDLEDYEESVVLPIDGLEDYRISFDMTMYSLKSGKPSKLNTSCGVVSLTKTGRSTNPYQVKALHKMTFYSDGSPRNIITKKGTYQELLEIKNTKDNEPFNLKDFKESKETPFDGYRISPEKNIYSTKKNRRVKIKMYISNRKDLVVSLCVGNGRKKIKVDELYEMTFGENN